MDQALDNMFSDGTDSNSWESKLLGDVNYTQFEDVFLTVNELSRVLKLTEKAIYYQVQVKEMPHYRFAGKLRFLLSEVVEWERNSVCRSKKNGGSKCQ